MLTDIKSYVGNTICKFTIKFSQNKNPKKNKHFDIDLHTVPTAGVNCVFPMARTRSSAIHPSGVVAFHMVTHKAFIGTI